MPIKFLATTAAALSVCVAHAQTDVVRLGVPNDRSGVYADVGGLGSEVAVRLAVEDFGGKVAGKAIEVIGGDTQNKADVASAMVRRWFDTQNLVAVIDGGASSTGLAAQGVALEKGGSMLITGGYASDFSGKACNKITTQWSPDTYALANAVAGNTVRNGGKSWFIIAPDYVYGTSMRNITAQFVKAAGGQVVGDTRHPVGALDFASFLLQAQASKADVVAIASVGGDLINQIKQAQEFGMTEGNQRLLTFLTFITDIPAMGLDMAQGLMFPTAFYWDTDEDTRAWTRRWQEKMGGNRLPTMIHALSYVAALHYLQAAEALGAFDGDAINQKMRELPIKSKLLKNAWVRPQDGRVMMDMYLVQVKKPAESKYAGDFYRILSSIPGEQTFVSLANSECPLVKQP